MTGALFGLLVGERTMWSSAGCRYAQRAEMDEDGCALPVGGLGKGISAGVSAACFCLPADMMDDEDERDRELVAETASEHTIEVAERNREKSNLLISDFPIDDSLTMLSSPVCHFHFFTLSSTSTK